MAADNGSLAVPDTPAVKRQKTASGYSTSNSGHNTGVYNSDEDSGDDLFANYIPESPATYQTQPTQIVNRASHQDSSAPGTPKSIVQVPTSSPITGPAHANGSSSHPGQNGAAAMPSGGFHKQAAMKTAPSKATAKPPLAILMAPAGTSYKPPHGVVGKPQAIKDAISISDDEGPTYQGGSSDDEVEEVANLKPTNFVSRSGQNFPSSLATSGSGSSTSGKSIFPNVKGFLYTGPSHGRSYQQKGPERARPIQDIDIDNVPDSSLRANIVRLRAVLPQVSVLKARDTLVESHGSLEDAVNLLTAESPVKPKKKASLVDLVSDSEQADDAPQVAKRPEFQMKRTLDVPTQSIHDRYSTQANAPKQPFTLSGDAAAPQKAKRKKLVQGRRNPSSPTAPQNPSPGKPVQAESPAADSYDSGSDSGVASTEEVNTLLDGKVLGFLNTCSIPDLVELTSITKDVAEIMLNARPFRSLDAARTVENTKTLKSGKRSNRAPIGDKIVDTALEMFQGYEAIDTLVAKCEELSKPLTAEMTKWGFDVFGGAKNGELEMTSLEDNSSPQHDSGIGTPVRSTVSNNDDEEDKITSKRRTTSTKFLQKPETMASDCILKDYQVVGLNWLALMSRHGLSGILADEMGLGKTCQVIAFLTHLVETGNPGPHLVVCPGSTLENWLREFQKFSPDIVFEPYHGLQKQRVEMAEDILSRRAEINVVVTTYDMAAKPADNKFMRKLKPEVCVYDEGHMLKNVKSQRYQGLIRIPARFRLLLTGTPLQNNLQELAALLAFILPDVFRDLEADLNTIFKAKATTSDADHAALLSAQRIARARSMLTPFVLRRKKAQVLKHLPAKTCRVEYSTLHKAQKEIYDGHLEQARERARFRVEGGKIPKTENNENNPLMQLRKAAIHPLLFRRHFSDAKIEKMADLLRKKAPEFFPQSAKREHLIAEMRGGSDFWLHQWCLDYPCIRSFDIPDLQWMDSGKVDSMMKLVKQYKENGDRVLIFSQFSLVLDILEAVLNSSLVSFTRIDGSTKIDERQSLIDTFRDDESITVFLLTTKAGGTGINLMYANKVIIFDGSFNPQDDRQAENRAHRVGQTREVEVVRLVTKATVEEQIYALGQSKLELDGRVAGDEDSSKAEEAGEKAISKMLLEGSGMTSATGDAAMKEDSVKATDDTDADKAKGEDAQKKLPQRKKSMIMDMLSEKPSSRKRKPQEAKTRSS